MRTNIEIEDDLMRQAMKASGAKTKKGAVEAAMRLTVQLKAQEGIRKLWGIGWDGDLRAMRKNRHLDKDGFFSEQTAHKQPEHAQPNKFMHSPTRNSPAR